MDGTLSPRAAALPDWVPRHRIGVADYHRMGEAGILRREDRVELIEGELVRMSPLGAPHAVAVGLLQRALSPLAADHAALFTQSPVRLSEFSEPEPDVALVRGTLRRYTEALPGPADILLLVEVADASLRYDLGEKAALYARHAVPEYWVLDLNARSMTVHRTPTDGAYASVQRVEAGGTLGIAALPGATLSLDDILP